MRYHKLDGWRGFPVPEYAVAGASDTGMAADSPCRSDDAAEEIKRFRAEVLRPAGIKSRTTYGPSSNVFCMKRWVTVRREDFERATALALEWLEKNKLSTRVIHDGK